MCTLPSFFFFFLFSLPVNICRHKCTHFTSFLGFRCTAYMHVETLNTHTQMHMKHMSEAHIHGLGGTASPSWLGQGRVKINSNQLLTACVSHQWDKTGASGLSWWIESTPSVDNHKPPKYLKGNTWQEGKSVGNVNISDSSIWLRWWCCSVISFLPG